jgi:hypothetical protein
MKLDLAVHDVVGARVYYITETAVGLSVPLGDDGGGLALFFPVAEALRVGAELQAVAAKAERVRAVRAGEIA